MSESQPITPAAFAEALKSLPLSAVYAKVSEIRNSIAHLHRSNVELKLFIEESAESESDKRELESYISENEGVIETMNERVELCKAEVEERGQQWIELDAEPEEQESEATGGEDTSTSAAAAHTSGVNGINGTSGSGIEGGQTQTTTGGANAATTNGTSSQQGAPAARQQEVETEEEGVYL